jgi:hypothetical protein
MQGGRVLGKLVAIVGVVGALGLVNCGSSASCAGSSTMCGSTCADTTTDNANCGACGTACSSGEVCTAGKCAASCGGGTKLCGTSCADTNADPNNCGGCGTKCGAGEVCSGGSCGSTCATGQKVCSGGGSSYCATTDTDNANCGSCGNQCPSGEVCSGGSCGASCGDKETACKPTTGSPYCAATASDSLNCGSCGKACPTPANAIPGCSDSACGFACTTGYVDCNGVATDGCEAKLATDPNNCGGCGQACPSGICAGGICSSTGKTAATWETLPATDEDTNFSDFLPTWGAPLYVAGNSGLLAYNPFLATFSATLAAIPDYTDYARLVVDSGSLYAITGGVVSQYDIATNAWSSVLTGVTDNSQNQSTKDGSGIIWSVTTEATPELLRYDISKKAVTYLPLGVVGAAYEVRVAWDPATNKLFIGPNFQSGEFHSYDIKTATLATLTSHPEAYMNDIFCSDHSGHIYAAGNPADGATIWQYTIASDTWAQIPILPFSKGNEGGCTVSADGWLYVSDGETNFARIHLE